MRRRLLSIICISVMLLTSLCAFCACGKTEEERPLVQYGDFLTLQQAFDQGLLTHDDLEIIAFFHNDITIGGKRFPAPEYPEQLDEGTVQVIKESWVCYEASLLEYSDATMRNTEIEKYYGTYDGNVAVLIPKHWLLPATRTVEVDGIEFFYGHYNIEIMLFVLYNK